MKTPKVGCRRQTEGVKKRRPPRPKGRSALRGTTFIYTQKDASLRCIGRTLSLQSDLPRALSPNRLAAHGRFSLTAARAYSSFSTGSSYTWIIIGGFRRVVNGFLFSAVPPFQQRPPQLAVNVHLAGKAAIRGAHFFQIAHVQHGLGPYPRP